MLTELNVLLLWTSHKNRLCSLLKLFPMALETETLEMQLLDKVLIAVFIIHKPTKIIPIKIMAK